MVMIAAIRTAQEEIFLKYCNNLLTGMVVATLPGAWRYGVIVKIGWPGVCVCVYCDWVG